MIKIENHKAVKSYEFDAETTVQKITDGSIFNNIRKELSTLIKQDLEENTTVLLNNRWFSFNIYFNVVSSSFTFDYSYGHSIFIRKINNKNKKLVADLSKSFINEEDVFKDVVRLIKKATECNLVQDYYDYQLKGESFFNFDGLFHPEIDLKDYFKKLLYEDRMNNDNYHLIQDEKYKKIFNKVFIDELKVVTKYSELPENFKKIIPYLENYQIEFCYEFMIKYLVKYGQESLNSLKDKLPIVLTDEYLHLGQYQDIFIAALKKALKKESNELLKNNHLYNSRSSELSTLIKIKEYFDTIVAHKFNLTGARIIKLDQSIKTNNSDYNYLMNNLILFPHINNTIEINDTYKFLWEATAIAFQDILYNKHKVYQVYDSIDNIRTTIKMVQEQINLGIIIETNNLKDIINYLKRIQEFLEKLKELGLLIDIKLNDLKKFDYLIQ